MEPRPANYANARQPDVPNYLWQSIVVTILCCLPLGIPAIVYATKVNTLLMQNNVPAAREASKSAKTWCWVAFGLGLVSFLLIVLLQSAIAVPSFMKARQDARSHACCNNLRLLEQAKENYAMENNIADNNTTAPTEAQLTVYLKGNMLPVCRAGGAYTIGPIGTPPGCSLGPANNGYHNIVP